MRLFNDIIITGNRAICKSYAKINLTLDITGVRDNGYHDIETIMQTLNLFDLIIVDKTAKGIRIKTNLKYLPEDSKNIAYVAAELFFKTSKIKGGAKILIHKNIPVGAGLAGGSGNGAVVLCALNKLYDYPLSEEEIIKISVKLGADVPYCIMGGTALAKGIGEKLTELRGVPKMTVLLVKPSISVSTADVYKQYDICKEKTHPDTEAMKKAIEKGDIDKIANCLGNTLESVTLKNNPCVEDIKQKMILYGAAGSVMSGSGPTVFGIFNDEIKAKRAADKFFKKYEEVFICKTLN